MKGLLFDRQDQSSFKKVAPLLSQIKHDIEEMLGFKGLQVPARNEPRKSPYASSRGGSITPPASPLINKRTSAKPHASRRQSFDDVVHIIKLTPPKPKRSQSTAPKKSNRDRNYTPSFPQMQSLPIPNKKQSIWEKLYKGPVSRQSKSNPYYRLDMKFEQLAERVNQLRQSPVINENSRDYYGILGRMMSSSPVRSSHERSHHNQRNL